MRQLSRFPQGWRRLADVLDAVANVVEADEIGARARQLAAGLSGGYGHVAINFTAIDASAPSTRLMLEGEVLAHDGHRAGRVELGFDRDPDGHLAVYLGDLSLAPWAQRHAFTALVDQLELYFRNCGTARLEARGDSNVLAELGFTWNPSHGQQPMFDLAERTVDLVWDSSTTEAAREALNNVLDRLHPDHPNPPTPQELLALRTDDAPDLGARLLAGTRLNGVRWLHHPDPGTVHSAKCDANRLQGTRHRGSDSRTAERLGDVLDAVADAEPEQISAQIRRLAADLSGGYGHVAINFTAVETSGSPTRVMLEGEVLSDDGHRNGKITLGFDRDSHRNLAVYLGDLALTPWAQRQAFTALCDQWEPYFRRCGGDRVEAQGDADVLAELGFTWNLSQFHQPMFEVRERAIDLVWDSTTTEAARQALNEVLDRLHPDHPNPPTPQELLALRSDDTPDLGARLLTGTRLNGARSLRHPEDRDGYRAQHSCA